MNELRILSEDKITGFPRPHIRSPWPDNPKGAPLTDRKIAKYAKAGKYTLRKEATAKPKASKAKLNLNGI